MESIESSYMRIVLKKGRMLHNLQDIANFIKHYHSEYFIEKISLKVTTNNRVVDIEFGMQWGDWGVSMTQALWEIFVLNFGGKFYDTVEERLDSIDYQLIEALPFDSPIDSIWVRRHNGMVDELYWLPSNQITSYYDQEFHEGFVAPCLAIYAFDTVKIVWDTIPDKVPEGWDVVDNGLIRNIEGKHLACNPIGDPDSLGEFQGRVPYIIVKIFDFILSNEPLESIKQLTVDNASQVEFYYQERMVYNLQKFKFNDKTQWKVFCYDGWGNCVTPEWLAYKQEIGLDE